MTTPRRAPRWTRYGVVTVTQGLLQAEVVRTYLRSHGIPTILRYESAGRALGITVDGLGEVQVLGVGPLGAAGLSAAAGPGAPQTLPQGAPARSGTPQGRRRPSTGARSR